jgi:hypothetical protein
MTEWNVWLSGESHYPVFPCLIPFLSVLSFFLDRDFTDNFIVSLELNAEMKRLLSLGKR